MKIPFADNLLFYYVRRLHRKGQSVEPIERLQIKTLNRILLMLTTGLGDAVLSCPVFPNLREALPEADIRLFCYKNWAGLFRNDPSLKGVIEYKGQYRHFFSTVKTLRDFAPELTLILHGNDPDILPLAYLAGSRYIVRIPWTGTRFGFLLSNYGLESDEAPLPNRHYVDNRLQILETIRVDVKWRVPRIYLPPAIVDQTRRKLHHLLGRDSPYWVFHALAADHYKVWPLSKARKLLETALHLLPDWKIIMTGSLHDRAKIAKLMEGLPPGQCLNIAGQFSLLETAACIASASLLLGPDTGILHLAAALETPTVALYAPTSALLVGPRSRTAKHEVLQESPTCKPCLAKKCPYLPSSCMDQISVERVLQAMRNILEGEFRGSE
jgi:ADP-heptose:LPS heptosyltransferase